MPHCHPLAPFCFSQISQSLFTLLKQLYNVNHHKTIHLALGGVGVGGVHRCVKLDSLLPVLTVS